MAVARITCPECQTTLRPAKPLPAGKKVKCPECGVTFPVLDDGPGPAAVTAKPHKPERSAPTKVSAAQVAEKKAAIPKPEPSAAPADGDEDGPQTYGFVEEDLPKPPVEEEEDDDEDEEDDDDDDDDDDEARNKKKKEKPTDINYDLDSSIKDLRGPACEALVKPMNRLIFYGVAGFLGWLLFLVVLMIPVLFPVDDGDTKEKPVKGLNAGLGSATRDKLTLPKKDDKKAAEEKERPFLLMFGMNLSLLGLYDWYIIVLLLMPSILGMAYAGLIAYGAIKAQSLESHAWGMVSSCMALFPYNLGGLIGLFIIALSLLVSILLDEPDIYINIGVPAALCLAQMVSGVVGLVTLQKIEVLEGFEYVAE